MQDFDFVIVGQGLAGTTLAWELRFLGCRVLVIDRESPNTASRIAAGLISPITGKRFATSWQFASLWQYAEAFYRRIEAETSANFLTVRPSIRLFEDQEQQDRFLQHAPTSAATNYLTDRTIHRSMPAVSAEWGGFEMSPAAQLDVPNYLDHSRQQFQQDGQYQQGDVQPAHIRLAENTKVILDQFEVTANAVVFCEGAAAQHSPWLDTSLEAVKGEVLTVRLPEIGITRVIHRNIWLAPRGGDTYLLGATFRPGDNTTSPTKAGRTTLLEQLAALVSTSVQVQHHTAAVRPIAPGRLPVAERSGRDSRIAYMNGLGSKGALRAPLIAHQFARELVGGRVHGQQRVLRPARRSAAAPRRLTELAHEAIAEVVQLGEVAIDATAGNGLDTVLLANIVGEAGVVFAFDIQAEAIERTQMRLEEKGIRNVQLMQDSHHAMLKRIDKCHHGKIAAVTFNLGYLPRGNKELVTKPDSTRSAVQAALSMLRSGGVITILAYTGHEGGLQEAEGVEQLLLELGSDYHVTWPEPVRADNAPRLFIVRRDQQT